MESNKHKLIIADYSEYPGPRYCNQGEHSGEDFYHSQLNAAFHNALENKMKLTVDLDGAAGYASSFLDEAFGNLVFDFSSDTVKSNIIIVSNQEPDWKEMIMNNIIPDWESRRMKNEPPQKTQKHDAWYRFVDETLTQKIWI